MKATEFAQICRSIATDHKTVYLKGVFGSPVTQSLLDKKAKQYPEWYTAKRLGTLSAEIGTGAFGFDCVCLIKGILWGWDADLSDANGGAVYASNGVPDFSVEGMRELCHEVSADFSRISVGEVVFMSGHVGVYLGDGLCAECTTAFGGGVLLSACNTEKAGYPTRTWDGHGKLRFLTYEEDQALVSLPRLVKGMKNSTVSSLQALLNAKNGAGLDTDGSFGKKTEDAVKAFQKKVDLPRTGVIEREEWEALIRGN